jgi:hypothetical protein
MEYPVTRIDGIPLPTVAIRQVATLMRPRGAAKQREFAD